MGGRRLNTKEKGIKVGMSHSKMSQYSIVRELGIPHSIIQYVLKQF